MAQLHERQTRVVHTERTAAVLWPIRTPGWRGVSATFVWFVVLYYSPKVKNDLIEPEDVPPGMELVGLSFTSVGATDPPK